MNIKKIKVNDEFEGKRIDAYISSVDTQLSRTMIQKLIQENKINIAKLFKSDTVGRKDN